MRENTDQKKVRIWTLFTQWVFWKSLWIGHKHTKVRFVYTTQSLMFDPGKLRSAANKLHSKMFSFSCLMTQSFSWLFNLSCYLWFVLTRMFKLLVVVSLSIIFCWWCWWVTATGGTSSRKKESSFLLLARKHAASKSIPNAKDPTLAHSPRISFSTSKWTKKKLSLWLICPYG